MASDVLPLPPVPAHLRPRSVVMRRLVLWLGLVVLFVFFYNYFAARGRGEGSPVWLGLVVGGGFGLAYFGYVLWAGRRWNKVNTRGYAYFNAGQEAAALPHLLEAARLAPQPTHRAISLYYVAGCEAAAGRIEEALATFGAVERTSGLGFSHPMLRRTVTYSIAACYGALGDVAAARAWLAEGERRRGNEPPIGSLYPEVLVLCREGHFAAAARTASDRFAEAVAGGGRFERRVRLLQAFALDALDAAGNAAQMAQLLAPLRPVQSGDIEPLSTRWPALADFAQRQGLVAAVRPAA